MTPYNSRQYRDAYHLLENVARWEKPQVHGVARRWTQRGKRHCTTRAAEDGWDLIARPVHLLSYNMAEKGQAVQQDDGTCLSYQGGAAFVGGL